MNPVLVFLILLAAVILWFAISFVFIPFGGWLSRRWKKTMEWLNEKEKEKEGHDER